MTIDKQNFSNWHPAWARPDLAQGRYEKLNWEPWKEKFCWFPTRIVVIVLVDDNPYRPFYKMANWVWLKTIFVRKRLIITYSEDKYEYEYEYAEDLFDLMKKT